MIGTVVNSVTKGDNQERNKQIGQREACNNSSFILFMYSANILDMGDVTVKEIKISTVMKYHSFLCLCFDFHSRAFENIDS